MARPNRPLEEIEDSQDELTKKIRKLARLIFTSKHCVVFTGAGISTAANIPDYRGPNGVWTLAYQNKTIDRKIDMIRSKPTFTHMFLKELYKNQKVDHILSQNCDGLHLRSGMPQSSLSEVHGNMFVEVCTKCEPNLQYIRPFDCTLKSGFKKHVTERKCDVCGNFLEDTIVHFGEMGKQGWPLNWPGTYTALEEADLIICMGTSLNVLKHYKHLWPDQEDGVKLVIINLQWTAKDKDAFIKINGRCDDVMRRLSKEMKLEPSPYCRKCDPVLNITAKNQADLMDCVTDCWCGNPTSDLEIEESTVEQPGWWAAEIARMKSSKPAMARSPSPEISLYGRILRKRKVAKGGRKKKIIESDFERDIRLTVIDLLNSFKVEPYEHSSRRGRGRPRKYYPLSIEKEGSFKFGGEKPVENKPVARVRQPDFDFDARDSGTDRDSDESHEGDPSYTMSKQMLSKTFWFGPARKKRGESGETKEWDLLPKRTRKVAPGTHKKRPTMNQSIVAEETLGAVEAIGSNTPSTESLESDEQQTDVIATLDLAPEHEVEIRVEEAEIVQGQDYQDEYIEEIIESEIIEGEITAEEIIIEDQLGDAEIVEVARYSNDLQLVDHEEIIDEEYEELVLLEDEEEGIQEEEPSEDIPQGYNEYHNFAPHAMDYFPPESMIKISISGSIKDKNKSHERRAYVFPLELLNKLKDAVFNGKSLLTGVAAFIEAHKQDPELSVISSKELIAIARRLREGRNVVNELVTFSLSAGAPTTVYPSNAGSIPL